MIRGFVDSDTAYRMASERHRDQLISHRQTSCPVELPHGRGWAYWTSHDCFSPDQDPGTLLLEGGEINLQNYDSLAANLDIPLKDVVEWIENSLFMQREIVENLTENEIKYLESAQTVREWRRAIHDIRSKRKGEYPPDWDSRIIRSGFMSSTMNRLGYTR